MEIVKALNVLWKVPKPHKIRASHKKQVPSVTWHHVWMKTRDFYFFRRKIYLTISIGYLRAKRKPVEQRRSLRQKLFA